MFDYQEAVRRLLLGNRHIRRHSWTGRVSLTLWFDYVKRQRVPMKLDEDYIAVWDLTPEDLNAVDWEDPAE